MKISLFFYRKTGQNDRQGKNLTGQLRILAGHCPLTGRYFAPCLIWLGHPCNQPRAAGQTN
jgi:hypothetical protein